MTSLTHSTISPPAKRGEKPQAEGGSGPLEFPAALQTLPRLRATPNRPISHGVPT